MGWLKYKTLLLLLFCLLVFYGAHIVNSEYNNVVYPAARANAFIMEEIKPGTYNFELLGEKIVLRLPWWLLQSESFEFYLDSLKKLTGRIAQQAKSVLQDLGIKEALSQKIDSL